MGKILPAVALTALLALLPGWAGAADASGVTSTELLKTGTTSDGVPLVYPPGSPLITSRLIEFAPGAEIPLHRHPMPLYAYILEGELTLVSEGQPVRRIKAGEAFMETSQWHLGRNETDKPVRLLSVFMGAADLPLSERKAK